MVVAIFVDATASHEMTVIIAQMCCNKETVAMSMYEIVFMQMFTACTQNALIYNMNK